LVVKSQAAIGVLMAWTGAGCAASLDDDAVIWYGWVLNDVPSDEVGALADGQVVMTTPDGEEIRLGEEPYDNSPGYFQIEVDPDTEVGLRLTGTDIHPTVWRARTPPATSFWLSGSLFGVSALGLDQMLNVIEQLRQEAIPWRDGPDGVLIYGQPRIQTIEDQAAWTGIQVTAIDADYHEGQVALVTVDETGMPALASNGDNTLGPNTAVGPVAYIVAWDLAPGPIRLIVDASDGRAMVQDWTGQEGDVLSAFNLTLPTVRQ
jgi:hypothetical protein